MTSFAEVPLGAMISSPAPAAHPAKISSSPFQTLTANPLDPVLRRLHWLSPLRDADLRSLQALERLVERRPPQSVLFGDGDGAGKLVFILSGWACRCRLLPDGRRQIFSLLLPGDAVGQHPRPRRLWAAETIALTKLCIVEASSLMEQPCDAEVAARMLGVLNIGAELEEAMLLDQVVRLGRQTALERLAHLLLELQFRLSIAGIGDGRHFPLPLTQEALGDVLGLSIVHVNRTLQQLRREGLIELASGWITLLRPDRLAEIAHFKPSVPLKANVA